MRILFKASPGIATLFSARSVRDNSQAVMLFGDRLPAKTVRWVGMLKPILVVENEVDSLLKKLGAG